jgi:hypothetical protein
MAKTRKRKRTPVKSAAPRINRAVKTARRRRTKRSGLADAFTPSSAKAAAMDMVKGSLGGLATAVIEKGMSKIATGTNAKLLTTGAVLLGSFITHAVMKQPSVSSGMMGAQAYQWSKEIPGLNDDAEFADEDALADEPDAFAEDGTPLYLNEGGELVSMEEMEFAEEWV